MKLLILAIGQLKEEYLRENQQRLLGLLRKKPLFENVELLELRDESLSVKSQKEEEKQRKTESERILSQLKKDDFVVVMDLQGKSFKKKSLKGLLDDLCYTSKSRLVFVIGGSLGHDEVLLKRADLSWRYSRLTYPHQLFRLILLETLSDYL